MVISRTLALIVFLFLTACETATNRSALDDGDAASKGEEKGVRVITRAADWPGSPKVEEKVTPLIVRIENGGPVPVDVRYSQLQLTMPDGNQYGALPPFRMRSAITGHSVDPEVAPIAEPRFDYSGFRVAPYYGAIYPQLETYPDIFLYNSPYYGRKFPYWQSTGLPTAEMLERALPEGVVYPGGRLEGWVYFEKIPSDTQDVALESNFFNSIDGSKFAELRLPVRIAD